MIIVDGHCDTLKEAFKRKIDLDDERLNFNIANTKFPVIQMMAIYISPEEAKEGFDIASKVLDFFKEEKEKYKDTIVQIINKDDIEKIENGKIGMMLTTENGSVIQGNLENIGKLYKAGVRMMSIVWNAENDLASGALDKVDKGLTPLGVEYIKCLNQKNILIDVSHSSEKTFWDTVKITSKPIVASHSCVYNICNHPRNLKDEQIKQIAKMNGIIGVVFCSEFLNPTGKANVSDVVKHIKYIKDLVGIDYVGLGSDFDGLEENHILPDLKGIRNIENLINALKTEFTRKEIDKILGENWIRLIKENIV